MPINNTKGLDALRSLAEGGSAGLNAYKSAQGAETASRTSALQGALGGNDVMNAANTAQAKYSPQVPTSGLGVGDLSTAANSYLSQAANKLSAKNYEDQQNLAYQGEALRRQNSMLSDVEKLALQGQADKQADTQRQEAVNAANGQVSQVTGLGSIEAQRGDLLRALYGADQHLSALATHNANLGPALYADPTSQAALADLQAQQKAARDALTQFDQGIQGKFDKAAGVLGTDTKGLQDQYNIAQQTGNYQGYNDLVNFLGNQGHEQAVANLDTRNREIDMGGQERLRTLAQSNFGINPDVAAGQFREGEGSDLKQQSVLGQQEAYVAGNGGTKAQKAAASAESLGLDPEEYNAYSKVPGISDKDIAGAVKSDNWQELDNLTANFVANGGTETKGAQGVTKLTGADGYREFIHTAVQGAKHADGSDLSDKEKQNLINMMMAKNESAIKRAFGKGEDSE